MLIRIINIAVAAVILGTAIGNDPPTSPDPQELEALVEKLASGNKPPSPKNGGMLPEDWDDEKQLTVRRAYEQVNALGLPAFPFLAAKLGDRRYCLTTVYEEYRNLSVGDVSWTILRNNIQPYGPYIAGEGDPRSRQGRPSYAAHFLAGERFKTWWASHKDQSRQQIQLEAIDWVIAEEAKQPLEYPEVERNYLRELRQKLVDRKEPFPPGGLNIGFTTRKEFRRFGGQFMK